MNSVPSNLSTTPSVHPDPISIHHAFPSPVPVDPDPGDVATNPTGAALAKSNTAPTNLDRIPPKSATPPIVNNKMPTTLSQIVHAPPKRTINPVPGDVVIDPIRVALASAIPVDPANPNSVATNDCTISMPADPVSVYPIRIIPVDPVHVDPVSVTPADSDFIIVTTILINLAFNKLFRHQTHSLSSRSHLYSISLALVRVFGVF
jgi:hypothetical protein